MVRQYNQSGGSESSESRAMDEGSPGDRCTSLAAAAAREPLRLLRRLICRPVFAARLLAR